MKRYLILEDGTAFSGHGFGAPITATGDLGIQTSNFGYDLSSFGPNCDFDDLVFLRFDLDLNMLFVYDTGVNSEELKKIPVSKTATVGDYQKAGKRPHIRIIESIIEARKLEPTVIFNIRRGKIVEKG